MAFTFRKVFSACLAVVFLGLVGCGGGGSTGQQVKAKGRVLKGGLPVEINTAGLPPGDPGLQVIFIRLGGADAGQEIAANVTDAAKGEFELVGADGKGIPPGKYRVAVLLAPYGGTDVFKGKYNRSNSKIEKEVTGKDDVVIELDSPTG